MSGNLFFKRVWVTSTRSLKKLLSVCFISTNFLNTYHLTSLSLLVFNESYIYLCNHLFIIDLILMIILYQLTISENIKFAVCMFGSETCYKIIISQTFYKNWLVVCTWSFHIGSNVIFSKKIVGPPMPLISNTLLPITKNKIPAFLQASA